jgi:opacity protein-like surface antigen
MPGKASQCGSNRPNPPGVPNDPVFAESRQSSYTQDFITTTQSRTATDYDVDLGGRGTLFAGYRLNRFLRIEGEVGLAVFDVDRTSVTTTTTTRSAPAFDPGQVSVTTITHPTPNGAEPPDGSVARQNVDNARQTVDQQNSNEIQSEVGRRTSAFVTGSPTTTTSTSSSSDTLYIPTAMVNAFVDFPISDRITPYVGAGIGVAFPEFDDTNFAYQGLAGAAFRIAERTDVTIGYRYQVVENVEQAGGDDLDSHNVEIGLRHSF